MKYLIILIVGFITIPAFSQKEIKIKDAKNHVGETVKICTKIFEGNSKGNTTFLYAGGNYHNAPVTLVIRADARKEFINKPEEYYAGKHVCVTGKIQLFKKKLQIVIFKEAQIRETIIDNLNVKDEPK